MISSTSFFSPPHYLPSVFEDQNPVDRNDDSASAPTPKLQPLPNYERNCMVVQLPACPEVNNDNLINSAGYILGLLDDDIDFKQIGPGKFKVWGCESSGIVTFYSGTAEDQYYMTLKLISPELISSNVLSRLLDRAERGSGTKCRFDEDREIDWQDRAGNYSDPTNAGAFVSYVDARVQSISKSIDQLKQTNGHDYPIELKDVLHDKAFSVMHRYIDDHKNFKSAGLIDEMLQLHKSCIITDVILSIGLPRVASWLKENLSERDIEMEPNDATGYSPKAAVVMKAAKILRDFSGLYPEEMISTLKRNSAYDGIFSVILKFMGRLKNEDRPLDRPLISRVFSQFIRSIVNNSTEAKNFVRGSLIKDYKKELNEKKLNT